MNNTTNNEVHKTPTCKALLPIAPKEQHTIINLFHHGLYRLLKSPNFIQRFGIIHEVQRIHDSTPELPHFFVPILLRFQGLQT
jgi:hypothetical protein